MKQRLISKSVILLIMLLINNMHSATITSAASGNWNAGATWVGGVVPTATDVVILDNNDVINITTNQTIAGITMNVGSSLNFNTNTRTATSRVLIINGNLTISGPNKTIQNIAVLVSGTFWNVNGTVVLNTGNTAAKSFGNFLNDGTFTNNSNNVPFTVNGNFTNNGTFTSGTGRVTFTGATSNTISGTAASTGFGGGITVNKGTSQNNILEVTSVITMLAGGLTLTNGTFKLSSVSTIIPFTVDPNIGATARLWVNGGTINSSASINWTLLGALRVDAGSLNFGTALDNRIAPNSTSATTGLIEINGGTLTATGRISSGTDPWIYTMTGGLCLLGTIGNTSAGRDVFNMDNATNGVFSMSGGTLTIVNRGGAAGENLGYNNTATLGSGFTGGVLQMGNASTTAGSIMRVQSSIPIYNLVINAPSSTVQARTPAAPTTTFLQITNDITIQNGTFDASFLDIEVGGDWSNASAVADPLIEGTGARRITFEGTATQTISNTGAANGMVFNNIVVNNTSTVIPQIVLSTNMRAGAGLTLTAGKVNLNTNTFTLGTSAATPGTLLRTADYFYGGTFTRWFATPTVAIGSNSGLLPLGTAQGDYRPFWVGYTTTLTSGGVISAVHTATYPATFIAASHNDASWGNTLQGVSNSVWAISSSTLAFNGSTGLIRYGGTGYGSNALADLNASFIASVLGTHAAATNVNTTYEVNRTGLNNISFSWRIGTRNITSSPLPITLLNFTSQLREGKVVLSWKTASEKNSDFIALERSTDGEQFEELDRKKALENSNSIVEYHSIDQDPAELNYYRLKLVDKDGSYTYSKTLAVRIDKPQSEFVLYPNPTSGNLTLDVPDSDALISVSVYNSLGELIKTYSGSQNTIDLSREENGTYFVRLNYADKSVVKKIVLSRH